MEGGIQTMEQILTAVTSVFTACIGMVSTTVDTVVENPLLLLWAIVPLCGIGVGFAKRLINFN